MRYGASNSTYRVDETVSGRITATFPLPFAASGLMVFIAEKLRLNDAALICGTAR